MSAFACSSWSGSAFSRYACVSLLLVFATVPLAAQPPRWTEQQANDWYSQQPWLVGSNYIPATAINQLEMWQADTFDPQRIDLELGWAEAIGLNTMRVFLHDLPWQEDAVGFQKRIDTFLAIADKHHIRILFVLFDSVWDPNPKLGTQHAPTPGVHNSGWVQSPGAAALKDSSQWPRLETYVKGVVGAFAKDKRVLGWDVWNEPSNTNVPAYSKYEPPNKKEIVQKLLPKVFAWAREAGGWPSVDVLRGWGPPEPAATLTAFSSWDTTFSTSFGVGGWGDRSTSYRGWLTRGGNTGWGIGGRAQGLHW